MSVKVRIPTPLRPLAGGRDQVQVAGATVRAVLENLEKECPGIRSRLCDERGELRRFVNLFLNDEDVRHLGGLDFPVQEGDVLSIVPAIAGGAQRCAAGPPCR
ncbi:MAG: molybdopterin synthase sulfur carrier subunit [Acidobacteria bacterium]|nr:MAG: molybdopterin synthase sulfur carrier subunit [Acidobacteriota bacterium]